MHTPAAGRSQPQGSVRPELETFSQVDAVTYPDLDIDDASDLVSTDGESPAFIGSGGFDDPPRLFVLTNPFDG